MIKKNSTPGYQYFIADLLNLIIEIAIYFLSLIIPAHIIILSNKSSIYNLVFITILCWILASLIFSFCLIFIKKIFIGKIKPGRYLLTNRKSYSWMFAERLPKMMVRSPFRGIITENSLFRYLYYRGMGAKIDTTFLIGPRTIITEPWSFQAGKNVLIGADTVISGHKVENNIVTLEDVSIGDNVLIGTRTTILPGVKIGNNVKIGANSVILPGTIIPDGETWSGNPAKKIDIFSFRSE